MNQPRNQLLPTLDSTQQRLLDELSAIGIRAKTILEIGCGAGGLHPSLLDREASHVVGIDLIPEQIKKARSRAAALGIADRTTYIEGDYLTLASQITSADIVILDKVIHCTHAPESLIQQSTAHSVSIYAVTFPVQRLLLKLSIKLLSPLLRFMFPFRITYTRPETIRSWIVQRGFEPIHREEMEMWNIEIYRNTRSL